MKLDDIIGKKYGKLTVVGFSHNKNKKVNYWKCKCDCGNETTRSTGEIICVNPDHLYVGTAKDNARDALERGQHPIGPNKKKGLPGERNSKAKLSEYQVKYIKFLCDQGYRKVEIAKFFKVHPTTIKRISNGKGWQCIL